mmetsp:Transcript_84135/g.164679  ORF Transcript_84135/g.164679 Transcript_84135/m.164679 type:complete len:231 (-) Transcript_84135:130-822(-)
MLAPVCSPAVSGDPIISAVFISSPSVQLDVMVEVIRVALTTSLVTVVVHVHAPSVAVQAIGVNVASNGSAVHDFLLNVLVTQYSSIIRDRDLGVCLHRIAAVCRVACHACVNRRTVTIDGLVLLASHVGNTVIVDPAHRSVSIATTTRASSSAVEKNLDRRNNVTLKPLCCDFNSVSNRGSGGMGPARTAVNRNVLIQISCHQALFSPVPRSGEVLVFIDLGYQFRQVFL